MFKRIAITTLASATLLALPLTVSAKVYVPQQARDNLETHFGVMDGDNNGIVTYSEFHSRSNLPMHFENDEIAKIFAGVDHDGNTELTMNEFMAHHGDMYTDEDVKLWTPNGADN